MRCQEASEYAGADVRFFLKISLKGLFLFTNFFSYHLAPFHLLLFSFVSIYPLVRLLDVWCLVLCAFPFPLLSCFSFLLCFALLCFSFHTFPSLFPPLFRLFSLLFNLLPSFLLLSFSFFLFSYFSLFSFLHSSENTGD